MGEKISPTERIQTVLAGEQPDRIPVALWRHFPVDDQDPHELAVSSIAFQEQFGLDLIKVTPASSFCLRDWGAQDAWEGNSEGTRKFTRNVIHKPRDWQSLKVLDPKKGSLGAQLDCLEEILKRKAGTVPVLQTIFNPLAQAKNLCGPDVLFEHLVRYPEALRTGLDTIARTTVVFVEACMELHVDGIFLAVQHANAAFPGEEAYRKWGLPDDLDILHAARDGWVNLLHLHGSKVYFSLAGEYPVRIVNWHDRESGPSLESGHQSSKKTVCGGWRQWETMALGGPRKIEEEALDAIRQMKGRHLLLGTGCVTPIITPRSCLQAAATHRTYPKQTQPLIR
jgi:uroporphyrinogen decarboxylase